MVAVKKNNFQIGFTALMDSFWNTIKYSYKTYRWGNWTRSYFLIIKHFQFCLIINNEVSSLCTVFIIYIYTNYNLKKQKQNIVCKAKLKIEHIQNYNTYIKQEWQVENNKKGQWGS